MNGLREKFRNKKGFTLVEMLIVVAIIAILVAVSIPVVGSALEKARNATDAANERALKGDLAAAYLLQEAGMSDKAAVKIEAGIPYAYDAVNGKIGIKPSAGYGQSTKPNKLQGMILYGVINASGDVTVGWFDKDATAPTSEEAVKAANNCITSTVIAAPATGG